MLPAQVTVRRRFSVILLAATLVSAALLFGSQRPAQAATFLVNSTADAVDADPGDGVCQTATPGECTLRAAVMEANAGPGADQITLPAGAYALTLVGSDENAGATGDLDHRSLDPLTILGAGSGSTIIDATVLGDRILHVENEALTLQGVTLTGGVVVAGNGGAILLSETGGNSFTDVVVSGNSAGSDGGGIYSGTSSVTFSGGSISANTSGGRGGGIAVSGGNLEISGGTLISNNETISGQGGGIYFNADGEVATLDGVTITGNIASGDGGGLYQDRGSVVIGNSIISDNSADIGGGLSTSSNSLAITVSDSILSLNYASLDAGAVAYGCDTIVTITNTDILDNDALGDGGGIGPYETDCNTVVTVTGGEISGNDANRGGAVYFDAGDVLTLDGVLISNNTATANGGGVYAFGPATITGATFDGNVSTTGSGGALLVRDDVIVIDSVFTGNQTLGGAGQGGAVFVESFSSADISTSTFTGNVSQFGGGGIATDFNSTLIVADGAFTANSGGFGGGAVYPNGTSAVITGSTFDGNSADTGGAIHSNAVTATVSRSTFVGNSADNHGAIDARTGTVNVNNSTFVDNTAVIAGAALGDQFVQGGELTVRNSLISGADPDQCGGTVADYGFNLSSQPGNNCFFPSAMLQLGAPADNGGPTFTVALLTGSAAIDAGDPFTCTPFDQRGVARVGPSCDIGAFEVGTIIPFDGLTPSNGPAAQTVLQAAYGATGVTFDFYQAGNTPTINADGTLDVETNALGADMLLNFQFYIDSISVRYTAGTTTAAELYGYGATGTAAVLGGPVLDSVFDNNPYPKTVTLNEPCLRSAQIEVAAMNYTVDSITYRVMPFGFAACDGIVVNTADDVDDGTCNAAHCSLREAILAANAIPNSGSPDEISFAIPGAGVQTIAPTTLLPTITEAVIIDGYTQPGAAPNTLAVGNDARLLIELNGSAFGPGAIALVNDADGSTFRGLVFTDWPSGAITLQTGADNNTIAGNFMGVDPTGTQRRGGSSDAVTVAGNHNTVGGRNPADRNVISDYFWGMTIIFGHSNNIFNNYIGTNAAGTAALPNFTGIRITTDNNNIGGSDPGEGNLIVSGVGIEVAGSGAFSIDILGNLIGANASGSPMLGFAGSDGIVVRGGASRITIGGWSTAEGNLITRHNSGIAVETADQMSIGNNVIRHNAGPGVVLRNSAAQLISIFENAIHSNGGLGIDLGGDGVDVNDFRDVDTGPNGRQNAPVLQRTAISGTTTLVQGFITTIPNTTVAIELYANTTCDATGYGEGETWLDSVEVETDSVGYASFQMESGVALPAGSAVTALASVAEGEVGRATSEFSRCVIVGPNNDSWVNAFPIALTPLDATSVGGSAEQFITLPGQSRWFRFPVPPQSKVIVDLVDLPADYNLIMFRDIALKYAALRAPQNLDELVRLTAEFAPEMFSPEMFSPEMFSPEMFSPEMFSPEMFSPEMFSPEMFSPEMFSPEMFSPEMFSPEMFSPEMFSPEMFSPEMFSPEMFSPEMFSPEMFSPEMFSPDQRYFAAAKSQSAVAVSGFDGRAPETAIANSWNEAGDFYVSVTGRNGAFSLSAPFRLQVTVLGNECINLSNFAVPETGDIAGSGIEALILIDSARIAGSSAEKAALLARLNDLAQATNGAVIDLAEEPTLQALNAQADAGTNYRCVFAKNLIAYGVKALVDAYRATNPITSITLVGNDDVIPFFRYPDQALLANESGYQPPVDDLTASQASLRNGYVLSQDTYGAAVEIDRRNTSLPAPLIPVGRLVEEPADIIAVIDAFLARDGAPLVPQQAAVVGYDFMDDAAHAVEDQLVRGLGEDGTVNTLIDAATAPPAAGWTADDMRAILLESGRNDVVFLAGHFSSFSALAADYRTRVLASEIAAGNVDMTNTIIFSNGCHSGYNIVNAHGIPQVTIEPDWAQAFARKGALLIAGTGYQYGDSEFIEYSERLYVEFSRELRRGTGAVAVGDAFVRAKQRYLADTHAMRPLHEKAYLISTLYGLPMLTIDMPGERYNPDEPASIVAGTTSAASGTPGDVLGLSTADVTLDPTVNRIVKPLVNVVDDSTIETVYYETADGRIVNPAEPVLPLARYNVTVPDLALRGVGFRAAAYADNQNEIPLTGAAVTELRGIHTPFITPVWFPIQPWDVNYFDQLARSTALGRVTLGVIPAQFLSDGSEAVDGTFRVYNQMAFRLFYNANTASYYNAEVDVTNIPALSAPPDIAFVLARQQGGQIVFEATVVGDPSAGIQAVWVTFTGLPGSSWHGAWQSLDLTQDAEDSRLWAGSLPLDGNSADDLRYIVQAVNGVGVVALNANKGAYFVPGIDPGAPAAPPAGGPPPAPVTLTLLAPDDQGDYGTDLTFTAELLSNGQPVVGEPVEFGLTTQRKTVLTDADGRATVTLTLVNEPTLDTLRVTYAGAPGLAPAVAGMPFTVRPAGTRLTLLTNTPVFRSDTGRADLSISLTDTFDRPLREKAVLIIVRDSNDDIVYVENVITDLFGNANLLTAPLGDGDYTVTAHFADRIELPTGVWDTRNPRYAPTLTPDPGRGQPPLNLATNVPPSLNAGGPYTVDEGGSVSLTAVGSDTNVGQPLVYAWDLNGQGQFESLGQTVTFNAADLNGPQTVNVTARVCDSVDECDTATAEIVVRNVPPTIVSVANSGPVQGGTPATISVVATDPADSLTYAFDCNNNGVFEIGPQAEPDAICATLSAGGDQVVVVRVGDGEASVTATTVIDVIGANPIVVDAGPDRIGFAGIPLTFNGSFSDPSGGLSHVIAWAFGDGGSATTLTAVHTYATPGVYTATLTVNAFNSPPISDSARVTILPSYYSYCLLAAEKDVKQDKDGSLTNCRVGAARQVRIDATVTRINSPLQANLAISLPPVVATAGAQDVRIEKGTPEMLSPGVYGRLEVKKDATIRLSAGVYTFARIKGDKDVTFVFDVSAGPVIVNVAGDVEFDKNTRFTTIGGGADDILFRVGGGKLKLDKDGVFLGTFYAPSADIQVDKDVQLTGALFGNKIDLDKNVHIVFQPALNALTAGQ